METGCRYYFLLKIPFFDTDANAGSIWEHVSEYLKLKARDILAYLAYNFK